MTRAVLVLEDGQVFTGRSYGADGSAFGEAVFSTGMTGYQETITDPSYCGQVVVQTAPHIGNTGWNDEDDESQQIWVSGYVVRDPARRPSNWRSTISLDDELKKQNVVGISDVDTRALTRHLRENGAMRVGIFSGKAAEQDIESLLNKVREVPEMSGASFSETVSTKETYVGPAVGTKKFQVAALDLGIKSMTPHLMAQRGIEVHVVPATISAEDLLAAGPDGIFVSNGPGDPATALHAISLVQATLDAKRPFFGICFGNQILGRALGFGTYKLRYGHRGINQPVIDKRNGKVEITSHNHGFAIQAPTEGEFTTVFGPGRVTHVSLNDGVVEGLELLERGAFSVQYHPEAAAGPHDAAYLFDQFVSVMEKFPRKAGAL